MPNNGHTNTLQSDGLVFFCLFLVFCDLEEVKK